AALFQQGNLLGIAEIGVGLVLDDRGFAVDGRRKKSAQRIGGGAFLVDFPDNRRRIVGALGVFLERLELFGRVHALGIGALQPQRPFDRHFPVAERGVGKNLRLLGFLEGEKRVADALDIFFRQLAVFLAEIFAQRLE